MAREGVREAAREVAIDMSREVAGRGCDKPPPPPPPPLATLREIMLLPFEQNKINFVNRCAVVQRKYIFGRRGNC